MELRGRGRERPVDAFVAGASVSWRTQPTSRLSHIDLTPLSLSGYASLAADRSGSGGARDPARRKGESEGAAAGFFGREARPVISGELCRRRPGRGRSSTVEAGKASRPLWGKRVP